MLSYDVTSLPKVEYTPPQYPPWWVPTPPKTPESPKTCPCCGYCPVCGRHNEPPLDYTVTC